MSEVMKDALEKQLDNCEEMKYAPHTSTNKQGCTIKCTKGCTKSVFITFAVVSG